MSHSPPQAPGEQMQGSLRVQVIQAGPGGVTPVSGPDAPARGRPRPALPIRAILRALLAPFRLIGRVLRSFRSWLLVLLLVLAALVAYYVIADRDTPLTTDAYVQAYVVRVAPQVSGRRRQSPGTTSRR
jgi:hypothetical protein